MQALNPANSAYVPTAQTKQTVALGLEENFPSSQSTHAEAEDEPELAFALPGLQSVQGPPTPSWLYFPTMQGVQLEAKVEPTLAVVFPATHAVHCVAASTPLYFPIGHCTQEPASSLKPSPTPQDVEDKQAV